MGKWTGARLPAPSFGNVSVRSTDPVSDEFYFSYDSFLSPTTLYAVSPAGKSTMVKQLPALFNANGLETTQLEATSADGTQVPYFIVMKKGLARDGNNPTLLRAYGGFQVSSLPNYSATTGAAWLERGGVLVLANIRGGGEFGPAWHRAALKENRQRAYDDFLAVAQDLITRKITSAAHLGINGGSNGGLLVGVALTEKPELFGAVVSAVPLLDMYGYTKLQAGASWIGEYGDPQIPEQWAYIPKYSPYQNVSATKQYPLGALHHHHRGRSRGTRARAQDGGAHGIAGTQGALLREHRGRPWRRRHAGAAGHFLGGDLHVPGHHAAVAVSTSLSPARRPPTRSRRACATSPRARPAGCRCRACPCTGDRGAR